jgi:hypothetical protein
VLNEFKDIIRFGSDNSGSGSQILTFVLNDEAFKKCEDFRYETKFILHFYVVDTIDIDMVKGVDRFDACIIKEYDAVKKLIRIKTSNKKFYNNAELKLLRKDKIGSLLLEFGDEDTAI